MGGVLNNITVPDAYSDAATLPCPMTVRVRLTINNQAIYWQRGIQPPGAGGIQWEDEEFQLPGLYVFGDRMDAIRVRAAVPAAEIGPPGKQAQVTIAARAESELE